MGDDYSAKSPLCVDLDGTLIKTDLLWESLLALLKQNPLSIVLLLVTAACVAVHALLFVFAGLPLPYERTALFFVPLLTALAGALLSLEAASRPAVWIRRAGIGVLVVTAFTFGAQLRDSYFREWRICADVRTAFPVLLGLCPPSGRCSVAVDQNLASSFNFYRLLHGVSSRLDEFQNYDTLPEDKQIYVALESRLNIASAEGLEIVWRGPVSDLVILMRPAAVSR
mgnify:CR=1 FL=1